MMSASSSRPDSSRMPFSVNVVDPVGHHGRAAVLDRLEQVGVGHRAQPLVPRVVGRAEVLVDRIILGQLLGVEVPDDPLGRGRIPLAELEHRTLLEDVLTASQGITELAAEQLLCRIGDGVLGRHRHDVGRRPLQHGHMAGAPGHGRQQRHSGGAAADDDHLLAGVVQVLGPLLRVHDLPGEALAPLELRRVALVVAVVAAGAEQPVGADLHPLAAIGALDVDDPTGVGTRPGRPVHLVVEPDLAVDAVLGGGLAQVGKDLVSGRDGVLVAPRLELVAEGVQVGV